MEIVAVENFF